MPIFAALQHIDPSLFVLRPEVAAREASYTGYATGNESAYQLLDAETRRNPSIDPLWDVLDKLERGLLVDEEGERRRQASWAEIRAGMGVSAKDAKRPS